MRHKTCRTAFLLVFAGTLLVGLWFVVPAAAQIDQPIDHSQLATQCADRIEKWFSLITIQAQELDLEHVKIIRIGNEVIIPLKAPHGSVTAIRWLTEDLASGLEILRLLRQGKIGAVNVLPFLHDPVNLYETRRNLIEEMGGCQEKEPVEKVLGHCTECLAREWLNVKP